MFMEKLLSKLPEQIHNIVDFISNSPDREEAVLPAAGLNNNDVSTGTASAEMANYVIQNAGTNGIPQLTTEQKERLAIADEYEAQGYSEAAAYLKNQVASEVYASGGNSVISFDGNGANIGQTLEMNTEASRKAFLEFAGSVDGSDINSIDLLVDMFKNLDLFSESELADIEKGNELINSDSGVDSAVSSSKTGGAIIGLTLLSAMVRIDEESVNSGQSANFEVAVQEDMFYTVSVEHYAVVKYVLQEKLSDPAVMEDQQKFYEAMADVNKADQISGWVRNALSAILNS